MTNPTMLIVQEVQLLDRTVVRQVRENYDNGAVGFRIIKTLDFKTINVGALFTELKSNRLFLKATNKPGAVQRI